MEMMLDSQPELLSQSTPACSTSLQQGEEFSLWMAAKNRFLVHVKLLYKLDYEQEPLHKSCF